MADIFLSYSREDIAFARRLHAGLREAGLETWVDWQDIPPSTDWLEEIYEAIEKSDVFIFIISSDSVDSEVCSKEVAHAVRNNKRLIPIVLDDIPAWSVTPELAALNWIFFRESDDFEASMRDVLEAIEVDHAWVKAHTYYQNRALEWTRKGKEAGYLLRGQDLAEAEEWLAQAEDKDPQPTALQTRYLLACREESSRRQRRVLGGALVGVVLMVVLTVIAVAQRKQAVAAGHVRATAQANAVEESHRRGTAEAEAIAEGHQRATAQAEAEAQRQEALYQRDTAVSRELAAQGLIHLNLDSLDVSLLLSATAANIQDTVEARDSLLQALTFRPHLKKMLHKPDVGPDDILFRSVAISPDGSIVAAADYDKTILMWNAKTGQQMGTPLAVGEDSTSDLEFNPDGTLLASGDFGNVLRLWDVETQSLLKTISVSSSDFGYIEDIDFHPAGDLVAVAVAYDTVLIYDISKDQVFERIYYPYGRIYDLAFNPQGTILAVGDDDDTHPYNDPGEVYLWDMERGDWVGDPLEADLGGVNRIAFSPNGRTIAVATNVYRHDYESDHQGEILLWDVASGAPIPHPVNKLQERTYDVFFSADGNRLIGDVGERIMIWDAEDGSLTGRPFVYEPSDGLEMSPSGEFLASVRADGTVLLWDLMDRSSNIEHPIPGSGRGFAVAVHPDGEALSASFCVSDREGDQHCERSEIRTYDLKEREVLKTDHVILNGHVKSLAYHPDGSLVAALANGEIVFMDDMAAGSASPRELTAIDDAHDLVFTKDGSALAVAGSEGVLLLDASTGEQMDHLLSGRVIKAIDISADGSVMLAGTGEGTLLFLDIETGELLGQPLGGQKAPVSGVRFLPEEEMFVSSGTDGRLIFWDLESRKMIGVPIQADANTLRSLDTVPGKGLITVGERQISYWETDLSAWQEHACRIANRGLTGEESESYLGEISYQGCCSDVP
ncbi:MAG: TIR domain-containing protein [Anaerolineales bacterium]